MDKNKRRAFPQREEYRIMDEFRTTLAKRPWQYLEEGNYEKYLKLTEPRKDLSEHRKELIGIYSEILALIKERQQHVNLQFASPKYDLVKHDFRCICRNTLKYQRLSFEEDRYAPAPRGPQYRAEEHANMEKYREAAGYEDERPVGVRDLDLSGVHERPQIISSRAESEVNAQARDPAIEKYFSKQLTPEHRASKVIILEDVSVVEFEQSLSPETTLEAPGAADRPQRQQSAAFKGDRSQSGPQESELSYDPYEPGHLQKKYTYRTEMLMQMPSLDLEALHRSEKQGARPGPRESKRDAAPGRGHGEAEKQPKKSPSSASKESPKPATKEPTLAKRVATAKMSDQESEMRNDLMHLLETVPVFSDMPRERLREVSRHFKLKSYFTNSSIILAGEVPLEFFIVASGTVSSYLYESNATPSEFQRSYLCSDYFGEACIMSGEPSAEFFVAESHVTVQAMSASVFKSLLGDLFDAFRYRLKEMRSLATCKMNTMAVSSRYFNTDLEKFTSAADVVKAHSALGDDLVPFLSRYAFLADLPNLEKVSRRFTYHEYLQKEILVGVGKNQNLFLLYKGSVSLQVYEEDLNRQLELVAFAPGSYFSKFDFKSEIVGPLIDRSSFVAKDKLVLLCLEDKYVNKYLKDSVDSMALYLENLYKSSYLNLERNKLKLAHSDHSLQSSRHSSETSSRRSDRLDTPSHKSSETGSNESPRTAELGESLPPSSMGSDDGFSTSVEDLNSVHSVEVEDSLSPPPDRADAAQSESVETPSQEVSTLPSKGVSVQDKENASLNEDQPSRVPSLDGAIVSRRSFEKPQDVSIRSQTPSQPPSSRSVTLEAETSSRSSAERTQDASALSSSHSRLESSRSSVLAPEPSAKSSEVPQDLSSRSPAASQLDSSRTVSSFHTQELPLSSARSDAVVSHTSEGSPTLVDNEPGSTASKVTVEEGVYGLQGQESSRSSSLGFNRIVSRRSSEEPQDVSIRSSLHTNLDSSRSSAFAPVVSRRSSEEPQDVSIRSSLPSQLETSRSSVDARVVSRRSSEEPQDVSIRSSLHTNLDSSRSSVFARVVSRRSSEEPQDVSIRSQLTSQLDSSRSSIFAPVVSRRSSEEPQDVSIRSSLPGHLESARTSGSLESKQSELLPSVREELQPERSESLASTGSKHTKKSSSDRGTVLRRLSSEPDEVDPLGTATSLSKDEVLEGLGGTRLLSAQPEDLGDLIQRISKDYEIIRKNTLLASHTNISDTEVSARSRNSLLTPGESARSKEDVVEPLGAPESAKEPEVLKEPPRGSEVGANLVTRTSLKSVSLENPNSGPYSSLKESTISHYSSLKESSNFGRDSKDSEVSSVASEVRFMFNLDKAELSKDQQQEAKAEAEDKLDSSRVMGNDNFVDIRTLQHHANQALPLEPLLERERSGMSERLVHRQTSSSQLITSRSFNDNVNSVDCTMSVLNEYESLATDRDLVNEGEQRQPGGEVGAPKLSAHSSITSKASSASKKSTSSLQSIISKSYPGVEESVDSVLQNIFTRSASTDRESVLLEQPLAAAEEKREHESMLNRSDSDYQKGVRLPLDFAEVPNLTKIISRVHDIYINRNAPEGSVSGSKFSSIDEVYLHLDKVEKMYPSTSLTAGACQHPQNQDNVEGHLRKDEPVESSERSKGVEEVVAFQSAPSKDQKEQKQDEVEKEAEQLPNFEHTVVRSVLELPGPGETESLFDLNALYRQSSYSTVNTLVNMFETPESQTPTVPAEDGVVENQEEPNEGFALSIERIAGSISEHMSIGALSEGLSMQNFAAELPFHNLTSDLSIDKVTGDLSFEAITKDLSLDALSRELSNIGSSISSQISSALSSKSSVAQDQEEPAVEAEPVAESEQEVPVEGASPDPEAFSLRAPSKLIITRLFDSVTSSEEQVQTEEAAEEPEEPEVQADEEVVQAPRTLRDEVECMLSDKNVLIDKYNLVSRISLDSSSSVTSTSRTDEATSDSSSHKDPASPPEIESVSGTESQSRLEEPATSGSESETASSAQAESLSASDLGEATAVTRTDLSELETPSAWKAPSLASSEPAANLPERTGIVSTEGSSAFASEKDTESLLSSEQPDKLSVAASEEESVATGKDNYSLVSTEKDERLSALQNDKDSPLTSEQEEASLVSLDKGASPTSGVAPTESSMARDTDKLSEKSLGSSLTLTSSIASVDTSNLSTDSESNLTSSSFTTSDDDMTDNQPESNEDGTSIASSLNNASVDESGKGGDDSGRVDSLDSFSSRRSESLDSLIAAPFSGQDLSSNGARAEYTRIGSAGTNWDESDANENDSEEEGYARPGRFDSLRQYARMDRYDYMDESEYKYPTLDEDEQYYQDTTDSEEIEYDEEAILGIKNLLMSTLKNKYRSLGAAFTAMDVERTGRVTREVFLGFIEKLGIGAIDRREQNLMFELLKEEGQEHITLAAFFRCSGEVVATLPELNQHLTSIFGSSRMAFERFFTTLKKSTRCSRVDFSMILSEVGVPQEHADALFELLDVCANDSVTVFTMLKMIVGDWEDAVALEYEQKINTNLNRLINYLSPESLEEFNREFSRTLSSHFFDQNAEGALVTSSYEEFYIEQDLKFFDELSAILAQHTEFDGISLAQRRFIVSLFNVVDTSPQEESMSDQDGEQEIVLITAGEVEAPLVALVHGVVQMKFEGITYPKSQDFADPCLPNHSQFMRSLEAFTPSPESLGSSEPSARPECGYSLSFEFGRGLNTVLGIMPLASYFYNVAPLLAERARRLPVMLQFLKCVPGFAGYAPEELERIVAACTVREFKLHETVVRTGEPATHFYVVFDGSLTLKNELNQEFKTLGRAGLFSAQDLVGNQLNSFTLVANCSLVLLSWERTEFFRVFPRYSALLEADACTAKDFENVPLPKPVDKKVSFAETA